MRKIFMDCTLRDSLPIEMHLTSIVFLLPMNDHLLFFGPFWPVFYIGNWGVEISNYTFFIRKS